MKYGTCKCQVLATSTSVGIDAVLWPISMWPSANSTRPTVAVYVLAHSSDFRGHGTLCRETGSRQHIGQNRSLSALQEQYISCIGVPSLFACRFSLKFCAVPLCHVSCLECFVLCSDCCTCDEPVVTAIMISLHSLRSVEQSQWFRSECATSNYSGICT